MLFGCSSTEPTPERFDKLEHAMCGASMPGSLAVRTMQLCSMMGVSNHQARAIIIAANWLTAAFQAVDALPERIAQLGASAPLPSEAAARKNKKLTQLTVLPEETFAAVPVTSALLRGTARAEYILQACKPAAQVRLLVLYGMGGHSASMHHWYEDAPDWLEVSPLINCLLEQQCHRDLRN